jgi:hypothetical protein
MEKFFKITEKEKNDIVGLLASVIISVAEGQKIANVIGFLNNLKAEELNKEDSKNEI